MYPNLDILTHRLLSRHGIKPRRRLGQNFVVDSEVIEEILSVAEISGHDSVLEIGAGLGTLTRSIAQQAESVQAVEIDPSLVKVLREELKGQVNVKIIHANILEMRLPDVEIIISNVPYSISSPLLLKILESATWQRAVLTLQKDFAARLVAEVGSKDYGRLTLAATYYAEVKLHRVIPPEGFLPPPAVSSQIVELHRRQKPPVEVKNPADFWRLTRILFTQRNRLLAKAIRTLSRGGALPEQWAQLLLIEGPGRLLRRRVRELSLADFAALSDVVSSRAEAGLG